MIDFTQETYASLRQEMLDWVPDTYDKRIRYSGRPSCRQQWGIPWICWL